MQYFKLTLPVQAVNTIGIIPLCTLAFRNSNAIVSVSLSLSTIFVSVTLRHLHIPYICVIVI